MIPLIDPIVEDENLYAWLQWLAYINGCHNLNHFTTSFFGIEITSNDIGNLELLCKIFSGHLPDIRQLLKKHTDFYALLPFKSLTEQAHKLDFLLHGESKINNGFRAPTRKYCLLCMKEDYEQYGRPVIHQHHCFPGVNYCSKHLYALDSFHNYGIILNDADFFANENRRYYISPSQREIGYACFLDELYNNPLIGNFDDLEYVVSFLSERKDIKHDINANQHTELKIKKTIKAATYEELKKHFSPFQDILEPLCYVECPICGYQYYTHSVLKKQEEYCPNCVKNMDLYALARRRAIRFKHSPEISLEGENIVVNIDNKKIVKKPYEYFWKPLGS